MSHEGSFLDEPVHPDRLRALRISFYLLVAVLVATRSGMGIELGVRFAQLPDEMRAPPLGWRAVTQGFEFVLGDPDPTWWVVGLGVVIILAATVAATGRSFRPAAWTVALGLACYLAVFNSYGKVDHTHHLVLLAILLAATPRDDRSGVTVKAAWVLLGLVYLFPGIAKLSHGPAWVTSDTLFNHLLVSRAGQSPGPLGQLDVSSLQPLLPLVAAGVILFEVGFVLAVIHPRTRPVAAVAGITFHTGTWLLMGISFLSLAPVYLTFLPWERLRKRAESAHGRPARGTVVTATVVLVGMVVTGALGLENAWPVAHYPTFSQVEPPREHVSVVVVVDGRRSTARELFSEFPPHRARFLAYQLARRPAASGPLLGVPEQDVTVLLEVRPIQRDGTVADEPSVVRELSGRP